jgi:hypothetical protein
VRFRGCICILITVAAAGAWLSASEFCPDLLLAGEQAVTLHTPIPDDELLPAELALLDRKLDPADAERRRLLDLYQGGFIELREMRRRATQVAARRKELQHKRTSLADERAALRHRHPRQHQETAAAAPAHRRCPRDRLARPNPAPHRTRPATTRTTPCLL